MRLPSAPSELFATNRALQRQSGGLALARVSAFLFCVLSRTPPNANRALLFETLEATALSTPRCEPFSEPTLLGGSCYTQAFSARMQHTVCWTNAEPTAVEHRHRFSATLGTGRRSSPTANHVAQP